MLTASNAELIASTAAPRPNGADQAHGMRMLGRRAHLSVVRAAAVVCRQELRTLGHGRRQDDNIPVYDSGNVWTASVRHSNAARGDCPELDL